MPAPSQRDRASIRLISSSTILRPVATQATRWLRWAWASYAWANSAQEGLGGLGRGTVSQKLAHTPCLVATSQATPSLPRIIMLYTWLCRAHLNCLEARLGLLPLEPGVMLHGDGDGMQRQGVLVMGHVRSGVLGACHEMSAARTPPAPHASSTRCTVACACARAGPTLRQFHHACSVAPAPQCILAASARGHQGLRGMPREVGGEQHRRGTTKACRETASAVVFVVRRSLCGSVHGSENCKCVMWHGAYTGHGA